VRSLARSNVSSLADDILRWLAPLIGGGDIDVLTQDLMGEGNRVLSRDEVDAALRTLLNRELIERSGPRVRLSEPDRPESELYERLEVQMRLPEFVKGIGVNSREFVFQKTATGGPRGDGRLTRPDFTLAAICSWRFDPQRTLEVYSFEVKNRAGTSVSAVYEAVAHGRFAHHPYLVCPRSRFHREANEGIIEACNREGVGLIMFDIIVPSSGDFCIEGLELVSAAERRSADPQLVEKHLVGRLRDENLKQLEAYAGGIRP
jgi:hypothetical protein